MYKFLLDSVICHFEVQPMRFTVRANGPQALYWVILALELAPLGIRPSPSATVGSGPGCEIGELLGRRYDLILVCK